MGTDAKTSSRLQEPMVRLQELAQSAASGELIVVGGDIEIRVYLQSGRLAWATSSNSRFAFTAYLVQNCGVEKATIDLAIKTCRKTKQPLGEWLVESGGVTQQQVQTALKNQVRGSMVDLETLAANGQALFIPRTNDNDVYRMVTFELDEIIAGIGAPLDESGSKDFTTKTATQRSNSMSEFNLAPLSEVSGYMASALVDGGSGMVMGEHGDAGFSLELAAAGNTEVVASKRKTMQSLGLADKIEDILISLGSQYHIIRPVEANDHVFIYVVLDRAKANLAMARHVIRDFEKKTAM